MSKPQVGFYWCAACGGCEEAVVDLNEDILKVVSAVDIVFWPVALDFKRSDVEAMADGQMAVCFINGAIRSSEQLEMAELLRRKAKTVIAFGSCSHMGGIPGLANLHGRQAMMDEAYRNVPSMTPGNDVYPQENSDVPEGHLHLPTLWETVKTLDQVIDVDYYLPGCPPPANLISDAVGAILSGQLPPKGTVLAPDISLCEECDRKDSKPVDLSLTEFKRPHLAESDPQKCLLAQGFLCLGAVTRKGCGSVCVKGNMPCTGCMGPTSHVVDFGAKALSAMASLAAAKEDQEIDAVMDKIVDPVGTFYRYSLPASLLHRRYQPLADGGKQS